MIKKSIVETGLEIPNSTEFTHDVGYGFKTVAVEGCDFPCVHEVIF